MADIRNVGLAAGIELEPDPKAPGRRGHDAIKLAFAQENLVIRVGGDTIALSPPLIVFGSRNRPDRRRFAQSVAEARITPNRGEFYGCAGTGFAHHFRAGTAGNTDRFALLWHLRFARRDKSGNRPLRTSNGRQAWNSRRSRSSRFWRPKAAGNSETRKTMRIGVPKEIKNHEYRVGMTPAAVRELTARGPRRPSSRPMRARPSACTMRWIRAWAPGSCRTRTRCSPPPT